jgi:hypothetical protein
VRQGGAKNPDQAPPVSTTIRANASGAVSCSHVLGIDHSAHSEPDRAGSGANQTSEDDPNLLYDGVADTLVSLLARTHSTCRRRIPDFRLTSSFVEDWTPTDTNVQWTRAPIGAHSPFLASAQKLGAQNELDRSFADAFCSRGATPWPKPGVDFVGRLWIRSRSIRRATRFPVGMLSGIVETAGS